MTLRKMNLRPNDMSPPEFHLAKVKEMHNGVVRVKGNANSVNLLRMEGGFVGEVLVGFCVILGLFFSVMTYGENGLFESVKIGLGVFLFFIAFILLLTGLVSGLISSLRSLGNYYQKYWDDFTFDGVTVKSRKFQIDASEITFVRPRVWTRAETISSFPPLSGVGPREAGSWAESWSMGSTSQTWSITSPVYSESPSMRRS